jgi:hypothetical protein
MGLPFSTATDERVSQMAGGVGVCLTAQVPGSLTFSNVRTSASLSKWASR